MAYSELIKNFENIRDYISQFYVYGFKRRKDYDKKAAEVMIMNVAELKVGLGNICVSQMSRTVKVPFCHLTAELFCIIRYTRHLRRKALQIRI